MTVNIERFGKITASKEVLNSICLAFGNAEERNESKGYTARAEENHRIWSELYNSLNAEGYFDKVN